jgi:hypothetical protein
LGVTCYAVPDHLSFCEVDGRTIFLDLRRDRYIELDPRTRSMLNDVRELTGAAEEAPPGAEQLRRLGLIFPVEGPTRIAAAGTTVPARSLLDDPARSGRPAWPLLPQILPILRRSRRSLTRDGLEMVVNEVRLRNLGPPGPATSVAELGAAAERFRAARRLIPMATNCLLDSLSLSSFLSRRGFKADLVFGVKLDPFTAHCWLQTSDAIVNDGADTVTAFTPVLVV